MTDRNKEQTSAEQSTQQEHHPFLQAWLSHLTPSQQRVILLSTNFNHKKIKSGNPPAVNPRRATAEKKRGAV
jgi:hypothetical protein